MLYSTFVFRNNRLAPSNILVPWGTLFLVTVQISQNIRLYVTRRNNRFTKKGSKSLRTLKLIGQELFCSPESKNYLELVLNFLVLPVETLDLLCHSRILFTHIQRHKGDMMLSKVVKEIRIILYNYLNCQKFRPQYNSLT
jgi:hypothetical protein